MIASESEGWKFSLRVWPLIADHAPAKATPPRVCGQHKLFWWIRQRTEIREGREEERGLGIMGKGK